MATEEIKEIVMKNLLKVEKGRPKLFNALDYTMYPARAMAITLQHVFKDFGESFMFKIGFKAGDEAEKEREKAIKLIQRFLPERLSSLFLVFEITGLGKIEIQECDVKKQKLILKMTNNPAVDNAKELYGGKSGICSFFRGVYSSIVEKNLGIKNCKLKETKCITKGDPYCEFRFGNN